MIVFVHLGPEMPAYLPVAVYQARLWNPDATIIVLMSDPQSIESASSVVNINMLPISNIHKKFNDMFQNDATFRNGFWKTTTQRFFVLYDYMEHVQATNVIHLESDVMLYCDVATIKNPEIMVVQDAPTRAIGSIVYVPHTDALRLMCEFMVEHHQGRNDMDLLALYPRKNTFPFIPGESSVVYDGAAIGQYLGGIDPRNAAGNTIGFVNETCMFRCPDYMIVKERDARGLSYFVIGGSRVQNLHIHSKQLTRFLSDRVDISELVTGERIQAQADIGFFV